jgi:hypothetical protein
LYTVAQNISSNPTKPAYLAANNNKPTTTTDTPVNNRRKGSLSRRSSVYQLIADAEAAHGKEEKKISEQTHALQQNNANPRSRVGQHRQMERELRIQADFQKRFPIPVRMPKAVQLDLSLPFDLEFVDYTWSGELLYTSQSVLSIERFTFYV